MAEIFGSLAVGILLAIILFLILRKIYKDKKAGKSFCGGDCSACGGYCHSCKPPAASTMGCNDNCDRCASVSVCHGKE